MWSSSSSSQPHHRYHYSIVQAIKKFAKDAKSLLSCSAGLGALIFFDDYASILIVGNSFQPLLGALKVCAWAPVLTLNYRITSTDHEFPLSAYISHIGVQTAVA